MNDYSNFLNDLAQRESSGNQSAINTLGYLGLYQMGEAALIDAGYIENDGKINNNYSDYQWTGVDGVNSYSDFLNNAQAQTNAVSSYHERVLGYLDSKEATDYIGQTIDGVLITEAGLLGAAHLVGAGAVSSWLRNPTGGTPEDALGTKPTEYMELLGDNDLGDLTPPTVPNNPTDPADPTDPAAQVDRILLYQGIVYLQLPQLMG